MIKQKLFNRKMYAFLLAVLFDFETSNERFAREIAKIA